MRRLALGLALHAAVFAVSALGGARTAAAQLSFAGDAPRIYTIEPREHMFRHELQLGVGILPLNAFYVGLPLGASYTYHFNDLWAWEVVNGFYSIDFDTGLKTALNAVGAEPTEDAARRVRFLLSSNVLIKPMYGKIAVFNSGRVEADTLFTAGVGVMNTNLDTSFAFNLGIGLHFWVSRYMAVRFDVRDYMVFNHAFPDNVLMIMISGIFGFSVRTADLTEPGSG